MPRVIITDELLRIWLRGRIWSTEEWLSTHGPGSKRPWSELDVEKKRENLAMYRECLSRLDHHQHGSHRQERAAHDRTA